MVAKTRLFLLRWADRPRRAADRRDRTRCDQRKRWSEGPNHQGHSLPGGSDDPGHPRGRVSRDAVFERSRPGQRPAGRTRTSMRGRPRRARSSAAIAAQQLGPRGTAAGSPTPGRRRRRTSAPSRSDDRPARGRRAARPPAPATGRTPRSTRARLGRPAGGASDADRATGHRRAATARPSAPASHPGARHATGAAPE